MYYYLDNKKQIKSWSSFPSNPMLMPVYTGSTYTDRCTYSKLHDIHTPKLYMLVLYHPPLFPTISPTISPHFPTKFPPPPPPPLSSLPPSTHQIYRNIFALTEFFISVGFPFSVSIPGMPPPCRSRNSSIFSLIAASEVASAFPGAAAVAVWGDWWDWWGWWGWWPWGSLSGWGCVVVVLVMVGGVESGAVVLLVERFMVRVRVALGCASCRLRTPRLANCSVRNWAAMWKIRFW